MKELSELIDWDGVLAQPRYAGGHEEVMRAIFGTNSKVIAWHSSGDYQGEVAIAHKLKDGRVVLMTDYYGSCSGCDAWEDSTEQDARKMINDLVQGAKVFKNRKLAAEWCARVNPTEEPWTFPMREVVNLVDQILAGKEVK